MLCSNVEWWYTSLRPCAAISVCSDFQSFRRNCLYCGGLHAAEIGVGKCMRKLFGYIFMRIVFSNQILTILIPEFMIIQWIITIVLY